MFLKKLRCLEQSRDVYKKVAMKYVITYFLSNLIQKLQRALKKSIAQQKEADYLLYVDDQLLFFNPLNEVFSFLLHLNSTLLSQGFQEPNYTPYFCF